MFICLLQAGILGAQTSNIDFEQSSTGSYTTAGAVAGWSISSQSAGSCTSIAWVPGSPEFSIVSTPIVSLPQIGILPSSPIGGLHVAKLNNSVPNKNKTRITYKFKVTLANVGFQFSFAGRWGAGNHNCCEQAGLTAGFRDSVGSLLPCPLAYTLVGNGCAYVQAYNLNNGICWSGWNSQYCDLLPYVGQELMFEATASDCIHGDHFGEFYLDFTTTPYDPGCQNFLPSQPSLKSVYCPPSTTATLSVSEGYNQYKWLAPPGFPIGQDTTPVLTLTNAAAANVYSVNLITTMGCTTQLTHTLQMTPVPPIIFGTSSSCLMGASGSATAIAGMGHPSYQYTWTSSSGAVIATNSIVTGLAPGNYQVKATVAGQPGCGYSDTTVTVGVKEKKVIQQIAIFCDSTAIITSSPGSNFQWYSGLPPVPVNTLGTLSAYTIHPASNGAIYTLTYKSTQNCEDSVQYLVVKSNPGSISVSANRLTCADSTNGKVAIKLVPTIAAGLIGRYLHIGNSDTLTPPLTASVAPSTALTYTFGGLAASGNYTASAFDGSCFYNLSFSVNTFPKFDYTLNATSPTLCPGNTFVSMVNTGTSSAVYNYTWLPKQFLFGSGPTSPSAIITLTTTPGNSSSQIYSVTVSPTAVACPLVKTITVTAVHLPTPVIAPIGPLCPDHSQTIAVIPAGGLFHGTSVDSSGLLMPTGLSAGTYTLMYSLKSGSCVSSAAASYSVHPSPTITISGNTVVCKNSPVSLSAAGADLYVWNGQTGGQQYNAIPGGTVVTVWGTAYPLGCSGQASVGLQVLPLPDLSVSGDLTICAGEILLLQGSGAQVLTWDNLIESSTFTAQPLQSIGYSLHGNLNGCEATKTIWITVSECTGLEENSEAGQTGIYPNPFQGSFMIRINAPAFIEIMDHAGRVVFSKENVTGAVDASELAPGVYIIKLFQHDRLRTFKLIKTNN